MRVRLLIDWADAQHPFMIAGTELDVDPATARQLLDGDAAELIGHSQPDIAILPSVQTAARTKRPRKLKRKRR